MHCQTKPSLRMRLVWGDDAVSRSAVVSLLCANNYQGLHQKTQPHISKDSRGAHIFARWLLMTIDDAWENEFVNALMGIFLQI